MKDPFAKEVSKEKISNAVKEEEKLPAKLVQEESEDDE